MASHHAHRLFPGAAYPRSPCASAALFVVLPPRISSTAFIMLGLIFWSCSVLTCLMTRVRDEVHNILIIIIDLIATADYLSRRCSLELLALSYPSKKKEIYIDIPITAHATRGKATTLKVLLHTHTYQYISARVCTTVRRSDYFLRETMEMETTTNPAKATAAETTTFTVVVHSSRSWRHAVSAWAMAG